jgi:hypothetical protein
MGRYGGWRFISLSNSFKSLVITSSMLLGDGQNVGMQIFWHGAATKTESSGAVSVGRVTS